MSMRNIVPGLVVGVIFGAGLVLSDLINPARVLAFLDVTGAWDATLAFVMAAALIPSAIGYVLVRRMRRPVMAEQFCIPENRVIESRLITGGALFGIGWGLVGLCPGPALAGLAFGLWQPWLFVVAMLGGMFVHRIVTSERPPRHPASVKAGG